MFALLLVRRSAGCTYCKTEILQDWFQFGASF